MRDGNRAERASSSAASAGGRDSGAPRRRRRIADRRGEPRRGGHRPRLPQPARRRRARRRRADAALPARAAATRRSTGPASTWPELARPPIRTSPLQRLPVDRGFRALFPLYPLAFRSFGELDADVVISSSSGWAHGVRTSRRALHVVYCYTPARWLYTTEYVHGPRAAASRPAARAGTPLGPRAAARADRYIAISEFVAAPHPRRLRHRGARRAPAGRRRPLRADAARRAAARRLAPAALQARRRDRRGGDARRASGSTSSEPGPRSTSCAPRRGRR